MNRPQLVRFIMLTVHKRFPDLMCNIDFIS